MASLDQHFAIDFNNMMSNSSKIYKGEKYRITVLSDRLIRFEYSENGNFLDGPTHFAINRKFPDFEIKMEEDNKYIAIESKYFLLQYTKNKPFKGPSFAPDSNLRVRLNETDKLWYPNHPEARNFKSTTVSLDNFNSIKLENGLYSTDGFAMIDDSKGMIINSDGGITQRNDQNLDFYLFMYKRDFGFCLNDYFTLTGKPALLPRYALGLWWNRDRIYNENDLKYLITLFKKHQIPLSVLLLSEFWHTKDHSNINLYKSGYTFENKLFPNPEQFINDLHTKDIKIGLNFDPCEGIRKEEPTYNFFASQYNITDGKNIPFNVFDPNFVNMFLKYIVNPLINKKVDFLWIDYKKDLKTLELLNYYIFNNYKATNIRPMILSRNSLVAAHRYPVLYSGETIVDWKTLNYLPKFNSNSSNIGVSWWSHDVGGFKDGIEDSELYLRYVQFSTFSPIFRFSAKRGPYYKREPWLWDIKTYSLVKTYCQLRYKLIPYIYSENYKYHKSGLPLVQPLYYSNPIIFDEPNYRNEYFFGTEFLISPITAPKNVVMNRAVERIFLPAGVWYDFNTGKKFGGNNRYVTFYKDEDFPVFVKEGAIIPLACLNENLNNTNNPKCLEINVFPGKDNSYKLYEDDGITKNYENNDYFITSIEYKFGKENYSLTIKKDEGNELVTEKHRDYIINFRNSKKPNNTNILIDNIVVTEGVEILNNEIDYIIKIKNVDITKELKIECLGENLEIEAVRILNEDIFSIINDLKITTSLKEQIGSIIFSDIDVKRKRIEIKKLKRKGLNPKFVTMFLKLLEYIMEI